MGGTTEQETVTLTGFPAERAILGGSSGVHRSLRHAAVDSLIPEKASQLIKSLTLLRVALAFPDLRPPANPRQVFQGDGGVLIGWAKARQSWPGSSN